MATLLANFFASALAGPTAAKHKTTTQPAITRLIWFPLVKLADAIHDASACVPKVITGWHRALLPQPGGFEGFPPCLEEVRLPDLPLAKIGIHDAHRLVNRDIRSLDLPSVLGQGDDRVACVAKLGEVDDPVVEVVGKDREQEAQVVV